MYQSPSFSVRWIVNEYLCVCYSLFRNVNLDSWCHSRCKHRHSITNSASALAQRTHSQRNCCNYLNILQGDLLHLESINVVVPFECLDETLVCDHSNESYWAVLSSHGAVCFWQFCKMVFKLFSSVWTYALSGVKLELKLNLWLFNLILQIKEPAKPVDLCLPFVCDPFEWWTILCCLATVESLERTAVFASSASGVAKNWESVAPFTFLSQNTFMCRYKKRNIISMYYFR